MRTPSITLSTKIQTKKVFTREVGECVYIFNAKTGKIFQLNETGSTLWKYLSKPKTFTQLSDHLTEVYAVSRAVAEKDSKTFVQQMHKLGYLSLQ
jgi:hypothetical protein